MEKRPHNLASLLHPISLDEFFANYWEKNLALVQRGDERYYEELLTRQNLDDIVSCWDTRYPAILLARDGVYYPPQAYCDDVKMGHVTFTGVPNLKRLSAEYGKGATIAMTSLDRSWRPLADLCQRLEESLDHIVKTNVYMTAAQTAGFPPHYDTHDILLLQIAGKKRWRIFAPTIPLPEASQPCDLKSFRPGPQLTELEVSAGDLLYLPRGFGHSASTSTSHSSHVTVGIHVYTWASILKEFDPSCVRVEELRRSLPPGFASRVALRPALQQQLRRLAPGHATDGDLARRLDSFIRHVHQARRRAPGRFRSDVAVLSAGSQLSTPPAHRYQISRRVDERNVTAGLTLDFDGNQYGLPAQLEVVLGAMCSRGSFRLEELPGGLDTASLVEFAGYLQSIGFLAAPRP